MGTVASKIENQKSTPKTNVASNVKSIGTPVARARVPPGTPVSGTPPGTPVSGTQVAPSVSGPNANLPRQNGQGGGSRKKKMKRVKRNKTNKYKKHKNSPILNHNN